MDSIIVSYKGKSITLPVLSCSFVGMFVGLMFSRRAHAPILLFDFGRSRRHGIHSYFVLYEFLAVWLDSSHRVLEVSRVKPWTTLVRPRKPAQYLVEIPITKKHRTYITPFLV